MSTRPEEERIATLMRQGAEAAARAKMFVRGTPHEHHYANLDSKLQYEADHVGELERDLATLERELAAARRREDAAREALRLLERSRDQGEWLVVRKRETDPPEVWKFDDRFAALDFFDRAQQQWTETYLCRVVYGPGNPMERALAAPPPSGAAPERGEPLAWRVDVTRRDGGVVKSWLTDDPRNVEAFDGKICAHGGPYVAVPLYEHPAAHPTGPKPYSARDQEFDDEYA